MMEIKQLCLLFPNKPVLDNSIGITQSQADLMSKAIANINKTSAIESYKKYGKAFYYEGVNVIRLDDRYSKIHSPEDFFNEISKITKGNIIKVYLALWKYCNKINSFTITNTKLTDIMSIAYGKRKFSFKEKQAFTEALYYLRDIEFCINVNENNKIKQKWIKTIDLEYLEFRRFKKDFLDENGQIIVKKGQPDERVINKIIKAEILPQIDKSRIRARIYRDGLLKLDGNKDERAIKLGIYLCNRFDQMRFKPIKLNREALIKIAGYEKTNAKKPDQANIQLLNIFKKLKSVKVIYDYEPKKIEIDPYFCITFYPFKEVIND